MAAFKSINIKPWSKEFFTEFYAAPPHYCFEAYEIRLHPHQSAQVAQSAIIKAVRLPFPFTEPQSSLARSQEQLYSEKFGNETVKLGNFTFENVSVGTFDIGVPFLSHCATKQSPLFAIATLALTVDTPRAQRNAFRQRRDLPLPLPHQ